MRVRVPKRAKAWAEGDVPCTGGMVPESTIKLHINIDSLKSDKVALTVFFKNIREQRGARLKSWTRS
jgi:hypothetical protein